MSKIALVADTHFGARNDNLLINENMFRFFDKVFFPYIEKHEITRALHFGDVFDRRKYINIGTLQRFREQFVERSNSLGLQWDVILGNHDTFYKNTSDISSVNELLSVEPNFTIHSTPKDIEIDGLVLAMLPWINRANLEESERYLEKTKAQILCGHLEINGFEMNAGIKCHNGIEISKFDKFSLVMSGHFHKKHAKKHIHYLGTPYQITFGDLDQTKGFHVLDSETSKLSFVKNPYEMFYRLYYDDVQNDYDFNKDDFSKYRNSYVKIVVMKKSSPYTFDKLMDKLYEADVANISIVETIAANDDINAEDLDLSEDTMTIIQKEIDSLPDIENPDKLKDIVAKLYVEAMNM